MAITANQVNELRNKTGLGMMECKKALVETDGDIEKAIEQLRKRGELKAEKRSGRTTANGMILAKLSADKTAGVLVELNCETDFVAKTGDFGALLDKLADLALASGISGIVSGGDGLTGADEAIKAVIGKLGENIRIGKIARFDAGANGLVGGYIHTGGQIGILVELDGARGEAIEKLALNLCQQIAFSQPRALTPDQIPPEIVEKERDVYRAQIKNKPENMIEKIVDGKLKSFFADNCLLYQEYIRDSAKTVQKVIDETDKNVKVRNFARFQIGAEE